MIIYILVTMQTHKDCASLHCEWHELLHGFMMWGLVCRCICSSETECLSSNPSKEYIYPSKEYILPPIVIISIEVFMEGGWACWGKMSACMQIDVKSNPPPPPLPVCGFMGVSKRYDHVPTFSQTHNKLHPCE